MDNLYRYLKTLLNSRPHAIQASHVQSGFITQKKKYEIDKERTPNIEYEKSYLIPGSSTVLI